jgi:hypothetical protein
MGHAFNKIIFLIYILSFFSYPSLALAEDTTARDAGLVILVSGNLEGHVEGIKG